MFILCRGISRFIGTCLSAYVMLGLVSSVPC